MPVVLYWLEHSPPVRSVNLVLHALDLPVEYVDVDLYKKDQLSPWYLKLNPLHTVPLIDDNGFILWESRAIMTYLVSKYGKDDSLYPKDLQKRAVVDQRLHYSNDVFYVVGELTQGIAFRQKAPTPELIGKIKEAQENIEKLLTGNKYIAGDSLTVADYSFITLVDLIEVYSPPMKKFPLTKEWFERCKLNMKNFDKANKKGADTVVNKVKKFLGQS
ncbi:glutathione S-transferase 1-like [Homalodisca vitripennis]|uniref:glutathione S-transferase 1-like n=1 Tax=Homalodisca vitripennis TaxID=197043 RepID=UPI001EEBCE8B|nr:glutathione S-transferase 1-like [Homalodisca vitripennis]